MCFKCLLCVYEEVRVKSRMRKVVSLLFFSFLFLCVLKNVDFSMHGEEKKKNSKSPNTKTEERKREKTN